MNFIKKDKYRHKIIEHLLNQYGQSNQQQMANNCLQERKNKYKQYQKAEQLGDMSQIDCINAQRYNVYQKAILKEKALIVDDDEERITKISQQEYILRKIKNNNEFHQKNNKKNKNTEESIIQNVNKNKNSTAKNIPQQVKRHQGQQAYFYHQSNPLFSISNKIIEKDSDINKKTKTRKLSIYEKQNFQNLINYKETKQKQQNVKSQRKYRFVNENKVHQALQSKRKMELKLHQRQKQTKNLQKVEQMTQNVQKITSNETQRSKGSRQMMDFLQSARQKLFLSKNNQVEVSKQKIHKQISKVQRQNIECKKSPGLNVNFQIQIQISPNKNKIIELNENSNPHLAAKQFIEKNKEQLFKKGFFNKKMEQILAERIQIQIKKHKKLVIQQKQKDLEQKYNKIIQQLSGRQNLLKEDQQQKQIISENYYKDSYPQNKQTTRKKYRKQMFSHVYVQKIESAPYEQDSSPIKQNQSYQKQSKNTHQNKNTRNDIMPIKQMKNVESEGVFQGYFNSPHQLITHRQNGLQNEQQQGETERLINEFRNNDNTAYQHFPISKCTAQFRSVNKIIQNFHMKEQQNIGASKILSKSRQKRKQITMNSQIQQIQDVQTVKDLNISSKSHNYNTLKINSLKFHTKEQVKNKVEHKQMMNSINPISEKIVNRIGKQNILSGLKTRQQQKRQNILKFKELRQLKQLEECSFQPKINKLSESIEKNKKKIKLAALIYINGNQGTQQLQDSQQNQIYKSYYKQYKRSGQKSKQNKRYDDLYKNHKIIEAKKQYIRNKSIEQIPFRPDINIISSKIMQTKRNSLNNSMCQYESNHQSNAKSKEKHNNLGNLHYQCIQSEISKNIQHKRKSMQIQRNREGMEIGDYLYKQAMKLKNKKDSAPQILFENFKPLHKSQKIINQIKQKRLSELFYELAKIAKPQSKESQSEKILSSTDMDLSEERFMEAPFKYILPLLEELQQLEVSLNRQQFIESGLKLMNYLSQDERNEILLKKCNMKIQQQQNKQNIMTMTMNKLSKKLVEKKLIYEQDIYHRGLVYKKGIKDKLQTSMQNKVRTELQNCTFKPKINSNFHSCQ